MPYYPTVEEVRKRLEAALGTIADRYKAGVQASSWKDPTLKQADHYYTALDRIKTEDLYRKGVNASSDDEWRSGAIQKGAPILPTRLRAALPKWESNWGPKYEAVKRTITTLPPPTPDAETNIDLRLKPIVRVWQGKRPA
jgi:hypothetical protein